MEMAFNSIIWNDRIGLYFVTNHLSNFTLMQEIIIYCILFVAIVFLVKKYFFPLKAKKDCGSDCGCS